MILWWVFLDSVLFSYFFFPNEIFITQFLRISFSGALRPIMPLFCPFFLLEINLENGYFI